MPRRESWGTRMIDGVWSRWRWSWQTARLLASMAPWSCALEQEIATLWLGVTPFPTVGRAMVPTVMRPSLDRSSRRVVDDLEATDSSQGGWERQSTATTMVVTGGGAESEDHVLYTVSRTKLQLLDDLRGKGK